MNHKPKKAIVVCCVAFTATALLFAFVLNIFTPSSEDFLEINYTNDDWAILNHGQKIDEKKGLKGIDLNILPALDKLSSQDELSNVLLAVVDTGVDPQQIEKCISYNKHEQASELDFDRNGFVNDYLSWDFYNNDNSIYDSYLDDYHGTYIATTISKINSNVEILPVKFLNGSQGSVEDAVKAIEYAIGRGAKIINCSWNFDQYNSSLYEIIKSNSDVLFVCAAGNSNVNTNSIPIYPCSFELNNIISVTAIDNTGKHYDVAGYGKDVDIAAPGVNIKVLLPENDEMFLSGTSISTAFVSAIAALMLSLDENLSPHEIKSIIIQEATKADTLIGICNAEGYIDAAACIDRIISVRGG